MAQLLLDPGDTFSARQLNSAPGVLPERVRKFGFIPDFKLWEPGDLILFPAVNRNAFQNAGQRAEPPVDVRSVGFAFGGDRQPRDGLLKRSGRNGSRFKTCQPRAKLGLVPFLHVPHVEDLASPGQGIHFVGDIGCSGRRDFQAHPAGDLRRDVASRAGAGDRRRTLADLVLGKES